MSKTLSFSKDRARVLVSAELDSVVGGVGFANPTQTALTKHVSSKAPVHKKPNLQLGEAADRRVHHAGNRALGLRFALAGSAPHA